MIEERMLTGPEPRKPDADLVEPTYMGSVRRYHAAARREREADWCSYHLHMAELHTRLASEHRIKAEKLGGDSL